MGDEQRMSRSWPAAMLAAILAQVAAAGSWPMVDAEETGTLCPLLLPPLPPLLLLPLELPDDDEASPGCRVLGKLRRSPGAETTAA